MTSKIDNPDNYIQYNPNNHSTPRQGGDNVESAIVISQIPSTVFGTTVGYNDDYDEVCPYSSSTSPDVVYSFTPESDIMEVTIDLCGEGNFYDTKVYVYEGAIGTLATTLSGDAACVMTISVKIVFNNI